ncbi:hypothetical protein [Aestuariivirga sp.]|uniref:hypothetical protein n=1 Tax=Aestuariivirga sp. TaxID=2650926 RepID=UPI0035943B67
MTNDTAWWPHNALNIEADSSESGLAVLVALAARHVGMPVSLDVNPLSLSLPDAPVVAIVTSNGPLAVKMLKAWSYVPAARPGLFEGIDGGEGPGLPDDSEWTGWSESYQNGKRIVIAKPGDPLPDGAFVMALASEYPLDSWECSLLKLSPRGPHGYYLLQNLTTGHQMGCKLVTRHGSLLCGNTREKVTVADARPVKTTKKWLAGSVLLEMFKVVGRKSEIDAPVSVKDIAERYRVWYRIQHPRCRDIPWPETKALTKLRLENPKAAAPFTGAMPKLDSSVVRLITQAIKKGQWVKDPQGWTLMAEGTRVRRSAVMVRVVPGDVNLPVHEAPEPEGYPRPKAAPKKKYPPHPELIECGHDWIEVREGETDADDIRYYVPDHEAEYVEKYGAWHPDYEKMQAANVAARAARAAAESTPA